MTKRNLLELLPLILLALAIGLSPSFPAGTFGGDKTIELRVEDFLMVILGVIWIASFLISRKEKVKKPPLLFPILVWVGIGFFSTTLSILLGKLNFSQGFFYFFKEIQYFFIYFYFFYHLKKIKVAKSLIKILMFLGGANVLYILYQNLTNKVTGDLYYFFSHLNPPGDNYGASALCEMGVFPKGMFFLLLFIFFLNIFLYYFSKLKISKLKKVFLFFGVIAPGYGVFSSGSRTSFLGLLLAAFLSLFFLFLKKRNCKQFLLIVLILLFFAGIFLVIPDPFTGSGRIIKTFSSPKIVLSEIRRSRIDSAIAPTFKKIMEEKNLLLPFFGFGKGYIGEGHNQYLLYFVWVGIMGLFVFFWLIFNILRKSFKAFLKSGEGFLVGMSSGLFVATISMLFCGLASDPFVVVKSAEVYWMFAGITMAVLSINREKYNE